MDGKVEVKIPTCTQRERKLRLRGKGMPKVGGKERGDHYITVKVKIPTNVSGKEKQLIEEIAKLHEEEEINKNGSSNSSTSKNEGGVLFCFYFAEILCKN